MSKLQIEKIRKWGRKRHIRLLGWEEIELFSIKDQEVSLPSSFFKSFDSAYLRKRKLMKHTSFLGRVLHFDKVEQLAVMTFDLLVDDNGKLFEYSLRFDLLGKYIGLDQKLIQKH